MRIPFCCPSIPLEHGRHISVEYKIVVRVHLPSGHVDVRMRFPVTIGTIPHRSPPLFSEQKNDLQQAPVYQWANPDDISRAVAALPQAPRSATLSQDPTMLRSEVFDIEYVYFKMPTPSVPSMMTPGGHEKTPLLDSAPSTTPSGEMLSWLSSTTPDSSEPTITPSLDMPSPFLFPVE